MLVRYSVDADWLPLAVRVESDSPHAVTGAMIMEAVAQDVGADIADLSFEQQGGRPLRPDAKVSDCATMSLMVRSVHRELTDSPGSQPVAGILQFFSAPAAEASNAKKRRVAPTSRSHHDNHARRRRIQRPEDAPVEADMAEHADRPPGEAASTLTSVSTSTPRAPAPLAPGLSLPPVPAGAAAPALAASQPASGGKPFATGSLVWARLSGFPWWPARVRKPKRLSRRAVRAQAAAAAATAAAADRSAEEASSEAVAAPPAAPEPVQAVRVRFYGSHKGRDDVAAVPSSSVVAFTARADLCDAKPRKKSLQPQFKLAVAQAHAALARRQQQATTRQGGEQQAQLEPSAAPDVTTAVVDSGSAEGCDAAESLQATHGVVAAEVVVDEEADHGADHGNDDGDDGASVVSEESDPSSDEDDDDDSEEDAEEDCASDVGAEGGAGDRDVAGKENDDDDDDDDDEEEGKEEAALPPHVGPPIGTIVWARLPSFPQWPALIVEASPLLLPTSGALPSCFVRFLGSEHGRARDVAWVEEGQVRPFTERMDLCDVKLSKRSLRARYRRAVSEARAALLAPSGAAEGEEPVGDDGIAEAATAKRTGGDGDGGGDGDTADTEAAAV